MAAAYRENKPTLTLMMTISRIAGGLFAFSAVLALVNMVTAAISGVELWVTLAMAANIVISLGVAAACFVIPHFFNQYSKVWNQRLESASKAEEELQRMLEEA
jgi:ABC-type polysaccharide/polyol phosphate export permease